MGDNQLQRTSVSQVRKTSLGESLVAARERHGLSREMVVQRTHIPAHYVQMLEDDDYRRISDQLYLLPFLRKYAIFLEIDPDETAMRLLREVQYAESNPPAVQIPRQRRNWTKPILFGTLIAVILGAYIVQSRHSDNDTLSTSRPQSSQHIVTPSSSFFPPGETADSSRLTSTSAASLTNPNSIAIH